MLLIWHLREHIEHSYAGCMQYSEIITLVTYWRISNELDDVGPQQAKSQIKYLILVFGFLWKLGACVTDPRERHKYSIGTSLPIYAVPARTQ